MSLPRRVLDVTGEAFDQPIDMPGMVDRLVRLAVRGLALAYDPRGRSFPHTLRGRSGGRRPVAQGMSVRDGAVAALGLSRLDAPVRRDLLAGQGVTDVLRGVLGLAVAGRDPGAVALALWATAELPLEAAAEFAEDDRLARALDRLLANVRSRAPISTVDHAWTVTALLAAAGSETIRELRGEEPEEAAARAAERLLAAQSRAGVFPQSLPGGRSGRVQGRVAGLADQMFTVQALTRYAARTGDRVALAAAQRCARAVARRQGAQGQWWAWYDWQSGDVVERYPLRTVNQHAIAPLALLELRAAGGADHRDSIARGLEWLFVRRETSAQLLFDDHGVVWGQVRPRVLPTVTRGLGGVLEARTVVRECHPQDLGWLLYTWHPRPPGAGPTAAELPPEHREPGIFA
jgi:hypothetical protein